MIHELQNSILARSYDMFAVLVEEVIVFPPEFAENPEVIEPDDFEVSFIGDVGMESADTRDFHKLPEYDRLPPEDKLGMVMDDIGLEYTDFLDKRRREGESDLEVRVEKCRKAPDRYYLDTRVLKIQHSCIIGNDDTDLMPPIGQFACKRDDTGDYAIRGRIKRICKINDAQRSKN